MATYMSNWENYAGFVLGIQGKIEPKLYINAALAGFLGLKEIREFSPFELFPPELNPDWEGLKVQALQSRMPLAAQFRLRDSRGTDAVFDGMLSSLDPAGDIYMIHLTALDQPRSVHENGDSRFEAVFELGGLAMATCSVEGGFMRVNESLVNLLGYSEEELGKMRLASLLKEEHADLKAGLAAMQAGQVLQFRLRAWLKTRAGSMVPCEMHLCLVSDTDVDSREILLAIQDLSESMEFSKALQRSESRFRVLFEKAPFPIGIRDFESDTLVDANQALREMFGGARQSAIGMHRSQYIVSENVEAENRLIRDLKDRKIDSYQMEKIYRKGDGTLWTGIMTRSLLNMEDKPYAVVYVNDITEFREQEAVMATQNEQLKQINDRLDRFAYSANHELRAPLTSILGLISLVQAENSDPLIENYLSLQVQSVSKLDVLLRQIVAHSENNNSEIVVEQVDLGGIVDQLYAELGTCKRSLKVERTSECSEDAIFSSDPSRIQTIMRHLLQNAFAYLDESKGEACVKTQILHRADAVEIHVEDNGIGIATEFQDRVFEMFFRGTVRSQGAGMGLFIAHEVVKKLGGEISLHSEPNKGTTFIVELPNMA